MFQKNDSKVGPGSYNNMTNSLSKISYTIGSKLLGLK